MENKEEVKTKSDMIITILEKLNGRLDNITEAVEKLSNNPNDSVVYELGDWKDTTKDIQKDISDLFYFCMEEERQKEEI